MKMAHCMYSLEGLSSISVQSHEFSRRLGPYLAKQLWSSDDRIKMLDELAEALLHSDRKTVLYLAMVLGPLTKDLLYRGFRRIKETEDSSASSDDIKRQFCTVLGELCSFGFQYAKSLAVAYAMELGSPIGKLIVGSVQITPPPNKRRKVLSTASIDGILFSLSQIVSCSPMILSLNWPWKELCQYASEHKDDMTCIGHSALVTLLSSTLQLSWKDSSDLELMVSAGKGGSWEMQYENCASGRGSLRHNLEGDTDLPKVTISKESLSYTKRAILSSDLTSDVVAVCGVLLPRLKFGKIGTKTSEIPDVVMTSTMETSLHSMALAVANCRPVIVEGPPGCGKSTLVEYLAHLVMGDSSNLIKVQLGEGVDSKVLSGMYKCTPVSGEFEWQLGALAQAVKSGSWILLEDIDKAPLDVISLLLPLLENGTLNIPGHHRMTDTENAFTETGFRIFMTCRTGSNGSGRRNCTNPGLSMLKRHARCIAMKPLQGDDLTTIVNTKYLNIKHLTSKILEIYRKLEDLYMEISSMDSKTNRRMSSVRDLFRLCNRVATHLSKSFTESELGHIVAMESVDCFVASSMSLKERESKILSVFSLLNLSSASADYFCQSYFPEIKFHAATVSFGRVVLCKLNTTSKSKKASQHFALTRSSSILLERVACAVEMCEPVLLIGETGVGKTSVIQYLAEQVCSTLHVVNISQQSSSADLLGAFKPVQPKHLVSPLRDRFERLFTLTFSRKQNEKFLKHVQTCFLNKRYADLLHLMMHCTKSALKKLASDDNDIDLMNNWKELDSDIFELKHQIKAQKSIAFTFVEGILSQAIRNGDWLLLDEINLACPETLDCLSSLLESQEGSVSLLDIGDARPIKRHANFRIFAAMNPATDVGKRNLPPSIRNRFLELFVAEPKDDSDLLTIISQYLRSRTLVDTSVINGILQFYRQVCEYSSKNAATSVATKPFFSLRSLCRALRYVSDNSRMPLNQALFEGLCLAFLTEIEHTDHDAIVKMIIKNVVGKNNAKSVFKSPPPISSFKYVTVDGYHLRCGPLDPFVDPKYIVTPYVKKNLKVLLRAVSYGKYPILIQGETSTGKTSIIHYLAAQTGNKVFRINNHEHTDLQEYIGCYSSGENGEFYFQEGPLVTAMREGHWVILDELNLAPTDILESLNRVLDDNRELFISETQETVMAHPRFTLFATQNPPGMYGGRKVLSRALRNRFIELHFGEIPYEEIKIILHQRCELPMSRCAKLIKVTQELQERRSTSGIFVGKHGFITLRDLFRWAERYRRGQSRPDAVGTYDWDQQLANDGYLLLAGRVRKANEKWLIQQTIEKHLGKKINLDAMFSMEAMGEVLGGQLPEKFEHIVLTKPLRRMLVMLQRALCFDEPVLLVGETGCGKTTACELITALNKYDVDDNTLFTINCHSHTDASDFLGGLRPVRHSENSESRKKLFEWVDGPLVQAIMVGKNILIDEISLAEDSVLERLNSVLEPARKLVIPDRVTSDCTESTSITAKSGFQLMATMNPGGDYGKKELSPALRNRLTEIWCTAVDDDDNDMKEIIKHNLVLSSPLREVFSDVMVNFIKWFSVTNFGVRCPKSIRDIMKWIVFFNICTRKDNPLDPVLALTHGALLVFIDGVGSGISDSLAHQCNEARRACISKLVGDLSESELFEINPQILKNLENLIRGNVAFSVCVQAQHLYAEPFGIARGPLSVTGSGNYSFTAPTTSVNTFRLLRALQLSNPILLEGSPGIGKTSLVMALAKIAGHEIIRINLSQQTDISDLLGADLPVEDGVGGQFSWRDGPLLSALKRGAWVVFDELNLASQSVLEGLNSVFDHRNEIFVPELGCTFHVKSDQTRIFACQNPYYQGGGRKGLPKSFLNRFNQVYMEPLSEADMVLILSSQFPELTVSLISMMVEFNERVKEQIVKNHLWGHLGGPWEFNLRDITRWCELVLSASDGTNRPEDYVYLIYCERLQYAGDRKKMCLVFEEVFGKRPYQPTSNFHLSPSVLQVGNAVMERGHVITRDDEGTLMLPSMMHSMESLITAMKKGWMSILTGQSGTGKTTLVKSLATLIGHNLRILSVNSSMDATELLGGFEQIDFLRHLCAVIEQICDTIIECCQNCAKQIFESPNVAIMLGVMQELNQVRLSILDCKEASAALAYVQSLNGVLESVESRFKNNDVPQVLLHAAKDCQVKLGMVVEKIRNGKGRFEWVDSELVDALKRGDWLLIEGANLCNPSVLDRLNAFLEPNGVLSITERGVLDGSFLEITPHPSFRLILSLDSSEGQLSRAMRNRGVEIHLLSSEHCVNEPSDTCQSISWNEVRKVIDLRLLKCFLPTRMSSKISDFLVKLFSEKYSQMRVSEHTSMVNCIKCSQEILEAVMAGDDLIATLSSVCSRYASDDKLIEELDMPTLDLNHTVCREFPPVTLRNIVHDTNAARVFNQAQLFDAILDNASGKDLSNIIPAAVKLFMMLASVSDWRMRLRFLSDHVKNFLTKYLNDDNCCLSKFANTTQSVFTSPLFENRFPNFFGARLSELSDLPWDPRWSKQLLDSLHVSMTPDILSTFNLRWVSFTTGLLQYETDVKIAYLKNSILECPKERKRKSRRKRGSSKQEPQSPNGILICSSLYHSGFLKLQSLSNQAVAYVFPLYQSITGFILNVVQNQQICLSNEADTSKLLETISEVYHIWDIFLSPIEFDPSSFSISIERLLSCFDTITNILACKDSKEFAGPLSEIKRLIEAISRGLDFNWSTVELQCEIRRVNCLNFPKAQPYQNEDHFLAVSVATQLLAEINASVTQHPRFQRMPSIFGIVSEICSILTELSLVGVCENGVDGEPMHMWRAGDLAARLNEVEESIAQKFNLSDILAHDDETPTIFDRDVNLPQFNALLPVVQHTVVNKLLNLINCGVRDKECSENLVELAMNAILDLLEKTNGLNAKVLSAILGTIKSAQRSGRLSLVETVLVIVNESSLSNVFSTAFKCDIGASIISKPFLTDSTFKELFDTSCTSIGSKTISGDLPLKELSTSSLRIWDSLDLTVSESSSKEKRMDVLKAILWKTSLNNSTRNEIKGGLGIFYDADLLQSSTAFFCYFRQELHLLLETKLAIGDVVDNETLFLIRSLTQLINQNKTADNVSNVLVERFLSSLLEFFDELKLFQEGCQLTEFENLESNWLKEVKLCLTFTLKSTFDLLRIVFFNEQQSHKHTALLSLSYLAMAWIWSSVFAFTVSCPQNEIDPVQLYKTRCEMLERLVNQAETELTVYASYHETMTGRLLYKEGDAALSEKYIHPLLPVNYQHMLDLKQNLLDTRAKTAYRPSVDQFKQLVKLCKQLSESAVSSVTLTSIMKPCEDLVFALKNNDGRNIHDVANALQVMKRTRASLTAFSGKLSDYPAYPDYSVPLEDSINHLCFGLSMMEGVLAASQALLQEAEQCLTQEEFFCSIMSIRPESCADPLILISFAKSMKRNVADINETNALVADQLPSIVEDVMISLLLRYRNTVLFEGFTSSCMKPLFKLLDLVLLEWNKQKERETLKEEEKASLYKVKHHLDDTNEENEDEQQFREIFGNEIETEEDLEKTNEHPMPAMTCEKGFSGLLWKVAMRVLEDVMVVAESSTKVQGNDKTISELDVNTGSKRNHINNSDRYESLHFVQTIDFLLPSTYAICKVGPSFHSTYQNQLNLGTDQKILNANICTSKRLNDCLKEMDGSISPEQTCNIYRDTCVGETKQCLTSLLKLHQHISETLLKEWPEHPVLLKIVETISKISRFSITLPIIKFVSGLEILLGLVQEWEKNASSSVSLQIFIEELTKLIYKWRRMELTSWNRLIDDEFRKQSAIKPSLYFSLYQLLHGEINEVSIGDVMSQLEIFMESSTIAQFNTRLEAIRRFSQHLSIKADSPGFVVTCLKNIYFYYSQFTEQIKNRIETLRKPIEKELKDFVKITKWNDQSFFVLKTSVEKTRRHLFKLIKKFSRAMQERVQCKVLVQETSSDFSLKQDQQLSVERQSDNAAEDDSKCSAVQSVFALKGCLDDKAVEFSLLQRLPSLFQKLKRVCSTYASENEQELSENIQSIEDFICDVIENANHLRNLQPATTANNRDEDSKAKRLAEAKSIKLRKQKALTDLFKYLSQLGLSYKKGIIYGQKMASNDLLMAAVIGKPNSKAEENMYSPKPGHLKITRKHISAKFQGKDYFYSNILKWSAFSVVSNSPHKDLTKASLDRSRGVIGHLMKMSLEQREQLSMIMEAEDRIKCHMSVLDMVVASKQHGSQEEAKCWVDESRKVVNDWCLHLHEFSMWLDCCPKDGEYNGESWEGCKPASIMKHGDKTWSNIVGLKQQASDTAHRVKCKLDAICAGLCLKMVSKDTIGEVAESITNIKTICDEFCKLCMDKFGDSTVSFGEAPEIILYTMDFAKKFKNHLESFENLAKLDILDEERTSSTQDEENVLQTSQNVLSAVLISIQNLKKASTQTGRDTEKSDLHDLSLTVLHTKLSNDITALGPKQTTDEIEKLSKLLMNCSTYSQLVSNAAHSALPVVKEFYNVVCFLESFLRTLHRTTTKLCYVLEGILIQLCQNGFCTPPDMEEELEDGEGHELENAEGGGVGEGEGSNDVSDEIEDQEMLEDKPGEQEQDTGGNQIDASDKAVEMDNDFEGQFDEDATEEKSDNESEVEEEPDVEKQIGDLDDDKMQDKLDEQFWGSDDDGEDEEEQKETQEKGKGVDETRSELAAKDDELNDKNKSDEDEIQPGHEEKEDQKPFDDSQFDPSENDPYAEEKRNEEKNEDFELGDDPEIDDKEVDETSGMDETPEVDVTDETEPKKEDGADDQDDVDHPEDDSVIEDPNVPTEERGVDDDGSGDTDDEDDQDVDCDALQPLPAEENTTKDSDNTISDKRIDDSKVEANQSETKLEDYEQLENKMPPEEKTESQEFQNEGNAPTENWDDTNVQNSKISEKEKDNAEKKISTRRRDPKPQDSSKPDVADKDIEKRLNIIDPINSGNEKNDSEEIEPRGLESEAYQHVPSPSADFDKRAFDSVTNDLHQGMEVSNEELIEGNDGIEELMDVEEPEQKDDYQETNGEMLAESSYALSEIHTDVFKGNYFEQFVQRTEEETDKIRKELEGQLQSWRQNCDVVEMRDAEVAWESYCSLTRPLAIELSEQLRLVLEPTQASQLKGDYRTGKRLNIRKMIPYIASDFRKDKIWLRRTKPNKRAYQVMLAIDDSSSMVDNHSKQLAFESVAVLSSALSSLEVGELAICSFGEEVQLLQNFGDPMTTKSGASLLARCAFRQKKTKIAKFLDYGVDLFQSAQRFSSSATPDISQLLLIISDGRGLYLEGRKRVLEAVASIHKARIFVAFIILDQPNETQGSITDIKVPVFNKPGEMPEIRSYMKDFPFPFYVILRNINVLPHTLGEALRQWFVLVAGLD